jgi:hypothetical protein
MHIGLPLGHPVAGRGGRRQWLAHAALDARDKFSGDRIEQVVEKVP